MGSIRHVAHSTCFFLVSMFGSAEAVTTYKWVVTNNFYLYGAPVKVFAPSTCTDMLTCPSVSPTSIPYGSTVNVFGTTNGPNPSAEIYLGYSGNTVNECGFSIAGGTASPNGDATQPNTFAYKLKYSFVGTRIQPGCTTQSAKKTKCDALGQNCTWVGTFSLETYDH